MFEIPKAPQYPYNNRLGEASQYTGQQLYNHLNMNLEVVGGSTLAAPLVPQTFTATSVDSCEMELTAGVLTTGSVVLSNVGLATESVIVEATPSMSGGITKPAKGAFKQLQVFPSALASATLNILAAYQALYGNPELGAKIFFRVSYINENTGQRIRLGQTQCLVTTV